jgi:2-polyprenyl-6-methoxyphenol hydroxylase-like FAD-dependent oxidoreductase
MTGSTKQRHAEIAGGGIAGLAAAGALARLGWSARVHERNHDLRELGAGILIFPNGVEALRAIGAYDEATAGCKTIDDWELRDHRNRVIRNGWMLKDVGTSFGILRPQLHQALVDNARRLGVEIVTDSRAIGATPEGELLLADGGSAKADLVIGADGVNSAVRDSLNLLHMRLDLGDGGGRHLIDRLPGDPGHVLIERWFRGRRIGIQPCTEERTYIFLCCPANDSEGRTQATDRSAWADSFPALRPFIDRIPDGGRWGSFTDVVSKQWYRGNVALLGDAAHAMSPNLGQNACLGLANAVALAKALENRAEVADALPGWEREQRPVTDATQRYSRVYGRIGTRWPSALQDLRSGAVWALSHAKQLQTRFNVAARSPDPVTFKKGEDTPVNVPANVMETAERGEMR